MIDSGFVDNEGYMEKSIGKIVVRVEGLSVNFESVDTTVNVLDNVSLNIEQGKIVGLVGESGSGKTTLGMGLINLLDTPPARIVDGRVFFDGKEIIPGNSKKPVKFRGTGVSMVFQEPLISLNPVYTVRTQLLESLTASSQNATGKDMDKKNNATMMDLLKSLNIERPETVLNKYPHELSGGMRQRVAIAIAIIENPKFIILDEPTTGLDVYVQNRILRILKKLRDERGTSMLLITHDLNVASYVCDEVYVMYAGRIIEKGKVKEIMENPTHPYTKFLNAAAPKGFNDSPRLETVSGDPPDIKDLPEGCKFNPRCPFALERCRIEEPSLREIYDERYTRCWLYFE